MQEESKYSLKFNPHNEKLELIIGEYILWWDDGKDGGGDWIVAREITPESYAWKQLGVSDEKLISLGHINFSMPIEPDLARKFIQENLKPNEFYNPDIQTLQLLFGRFPCPFCKGLMECEIDATSAYCDGCNKQVSLAPLV